MPCLLILDVIPKTMTLTAAIEKQRAAQEKEEMGDDNDGAEEEEINGDGSEAGSGDEADEESQSSRPMSEDEGDLSTPEDMDED